MNRTAWLAVVVMVVAPASALAQMGGMMGGMGGMRGGMAANRNPMMNRATHEVNVEMEGNRSLAGRLQLVSLNVQGDLGSYGIQVDKIRMIRFLKPVKDVKDDDEDQAQPAPAGFNNAQQAMMMPNMMRAQMLQNQTARAKVILRSGEEILGNIPMGMGFQLAVDYGTITLATAKLRLIDFGEAGTKDSKTETKEGPARPKPAAFPAASSADAPAPPEYFQHQQSLVIRSTSGDRVALYNASNRQTLELYGPKEGPVAVTPVFSANVMALGLQGPRIARVAVADDEGWHVRDLRPPLDDGIMPIIGQWIALYPSGRQLYAYSARAHRWDVVELPENLGASPVVGPEQITVEGDGHIFTFRAANGLWEHIDVRAILDGLSIGKK